jgi:hypothetical protein
VGDNSGSEDCARRVDEVDGPGAPDTSVSGAMICGGGMAVLLRLRYGDGARDRFGGIRLATRWKTGMC